MNCKILVKRLLDVMESLKVEDDEIMIELHLSDDLLEEGELDSADINGQLLEIIEPSPKLAHGRVVIVAALADM